MTTPLVNASKHEGVMVLELNAPTIDPAG